VRFISGIVIGFCLVGATARAELPDVDDPGVVEASRHQGSALALPLPPVLELENEGRHSDEDDGGLRGSGTGIAYVTETTAAGYESLTTTQLSAGRQTVDIEVRWTGSTERYAAIWAPVSGTVHRLIQGTPTEWSNFINQMTPLAGRWLDVEVGYFGADKRYSALFLEDGDDYGYAVHTTNTDAGFQNYLDTYRRTGRSLIDFEAYTLPSGETRFAGVWVNDPNQPMTHLYYNLESPHVTDLVNPLMGRIIDVERYYSDLHDAIRYAVLVAQYPGGGWGLYRNQTASQLSSNNAAIADSNTFMADLDVVDFGGGTIRYNAVWGDAWKSLHEVAAMPADIDPEPLTPGLSNTINIFENVAGAGTVGIYAKNLRTNQSVSYRPDEPFYLASASKTAIHIRYWMEVQAGNVNPNSLLNFSSSANTGESWYMDERANPGFGSGGFCCNGFQTNNDLGGAFPIDRFDRAMMSVSDNGATTALVDDPTFGVAYDSLDLNEWLSSQTGIGKGWGVTTSIHDVDRYIMYQSQQRTASVGDKSYFQVPGYTIGPRFRGTWDVCTINGNAPNDCVSQSCTRCLNNTFCNTGETCVEIEDPWGALADFFNFDPSVGEQAPRLGPDIGYPRYYNMLLSSATPRAVGNLWEGLAENRWLDATNTNLAVANMGEGTSLDDSPDFPSGITRVSKGGTKRNVCTDTGWFRYDGETIVYNVMAKDTTLPCGNTGSIRALYMPTFGLQILQAVGVDLTVEDPAADAGAFPTTLRPDENLAFFANVTNLGGGDADPVEVDFRLSDNTAFGAFDTPLAIDATTAIAGYGSNLAVGNADLPDLPRGTYYLVWDVNSDNGTPEYDDSGSSNLGFWPTPITVQARLEPIDDLAFTGKTTAQWSPILDSANYRIHEGISSALPDLAAGALDSCRREIVTTSASNGFTSTPPPGEFYWYIVQAENDGPLLPATAGSRSLDSAGECGTSCAQPKCQTGVALDPVCDVCVAQICDADSYCCDTAWDTLCVQQVRTVCGSLACDESAGACDHPVCSEGVALVDGCDVPPLTDSCVGAVCAADSFCCTTSWDGLCVGAVDDICGATCE
jgi:hypothetical protein